MIDAGNKLVKIKLVGNGTPFPVAAVSHYTYNTLTVRFIPPKGGYSVGRKCKASFKFGIRNGHEFEDLEDDITKMFVELPADMQDLMLRFFRERFFQILQHYLFAVTYDVIDQHIQKATENMVQPEGQDRDKVE